MSGLLNSNVQYTIGKIKSIQDELDQRGGKPDNKFWLDVAKIIVDFSSSERESLFTELHACIPDEIGVKALHAFKYEQWLKKNGLKQ